MKHIFITATAIALCTVACITGINATIVIMQFYGSGSMAYPDSDGDGFFDMYEHMWGTSSTDKLDNPFTRWIVPLLVVTAVLAIILCASKYQKKTRMPDIYPALDLMITAFQSAVKSGDAALMKKTRAEVDGAIVKIREGTARDRLKEPRVQELLMKYELFCFDAMIDEHGTRTEKKITGSQQEVN
nr:hypothetical protein [Candidatus Sigynarchaeota archaeon]